MFCIDLVVGIHLDARYQVMKRRKLSGANFDYLKTRKLGPSQRAFALELKRCCRNSSNLAQGIAAPLAKQRHSCAPTTPASAAPCTSWNSSATIARLTSAALESSCELVYDRTDSFFFSNVAH
jgi:hypothetical protein